MLIIPAVGAGRHRPGGGSGGHSEMPGRKQPREELALDVQCSRTTDVDGDCFYQLRPEVSSLADSDIRDLDFDSANVGAKTGPDHGYFGLCAAMRHIVNMRAGTAIPPMAEAPWPSQATPYACAFVAPPAWPMYMPRPPAQQASMQAKLEELARQGHDLETRELEVERRTRALNLNAVRDARVTAVASWQEAATPVLGNRHP